METWRCPHCGTTQADAVRCWACSRNPVACGSCRNFRRAVAGRYGYCSLDRSRATLQGDEVRACWQAPDRVAAFEGLFRELTVTPEAVQPDPLPDSPARDATAGLRRWALPVYASATTPVPARAPASPGQADSAGTSSGSFHPGLVDAPYVPARGVRSMSERANPEAD